MGDFYARRLILMKGFPATGKSRLAHSLCRKLGWPLIDKDDIKDFTLNVKNGNSLAYEIMWSVARRQLQLGLSVIVDSPLSYPVAFVTGQRLAEEYEAQLLVVETKVNEAVWRARLEQRDSTESEHKVASWQAMQEMLAKYAECWQYDIPEELYMAVNAALPVDELVTAVVQRMQSVGLSEHSLDCESASRFRNNSTT